MKLDKVYFPLTIFTAIAVGFVLGGIFIKTNSSTKVLTQNETKQKLNKLIDFIDAEYVDNVNTDSIVDQTVNGILEKLDPHSVYIAKNDAEGEAESMRGDFVGIGVNFFIDNDSVKVITPIKNGPADLAGIKAGDRIISANKRPLLGKKLTTEKLYKVLKGEPQSNVLVEVYRKSEKKKIKLKVTRNIVPIKSVDVAIMLNKNTGYIKINRFAETTFREFKKALRQIVASKANTLILDLRDNSGGYLEEAVAIVDELLANKKLIVFTKDRKGTIEKSFASAGGIFEKGKISVLINENSASASEIIAGAIQDNDRGVILGRRSFGKGLVQREIPFKDGSSVRLTVARYYTPTGRSIQKPYNNGYDDYMSDYVERFHNGELYAKDSIKIADTLKFKTPKGRIVYGGGGIVPDVFVPVETSKGNEMVSLLMQSSYTTNYVFNVIDKDRTNFEKLNFVQIVEKTFNNDSYFQDFVNYISKTGEFVDLEQNKHFVKKYLTAEFCKQLLGENKYYSIILKDDPMIQKALKAKL